MISHVTKHTAVLETDGEVVGYETGAGIEYHGVEFRHQDDMEQNEADVAPSQSSNQYVMGEDLWNAMGSPLVITISVVAGDTLNENG